MTLYPSSTILKIKFLTAYLLLKQPRNTPKICPPPKKMVSSGGYQKLRGAGKAIVKDAPRPIKSTARKAEEYTRGMFMGGTWFEELGFYYVGPVDGHDLDTLIPVLENVKKMKNGLLEH